jgi:hypothetical protein
LEVSWQQLGGLLRRQIRRQSRGWAFRLLAS